MSRSAKRKTLRLVVGFGLKSWNGAGIHPSGGHGWNQAESRPVVNLQIAIAFLLAGVDSNFVGRTCSEVRAVFLNTTAGKNSLRPGCAIADKAYDSIRDIHLIETRPEHFLGVLESDLASINE